MRVKLVKRVLDEFFELISKSEKFKSWTKLADKTSYSRWTIKDIKYNRRTFPKKLFEELLGFIPKKKQNYFLAKAEYLEEFWANRDRWNKKLAKLRNELEKKNTEHYLKLKARICGYLAGDGTIFKRTGSSPNSFRYDIGFYPDDFKMAESFNYAFFELYGKKFNIIKHKIHKFYVMKGSHKVAYFDLTKITKFGTHEWAVPFEFLKTKSMKAEWLRAFFDCEAHVGKDKIQLQSVNKTGLYGIKLMLESLGIETSKIYKYERKQKNWNTNYLLEIRKKDRIRNYLKLISFNHSNKKKKLESLAGVPESGQTGRARAEK